MRAALVAAVMVAGCAGQALPVATRGPLCVWHFLSPLDTGDSETNPGMSTCDSRSFSLNDGVISIRVERSSVVPVSQGAAYWFADVDVAGARGTIGVDLD